MSTRQGFGIAMTVLGGAGLVAGGIAGIVAIGKHDALAEVCPDGQCKDPAHNDSIDDYHKVAGASTAAIVAGGIFISSGILLLVTAPGAPPAKSAQVLPVVGPAYAEVRGVF